MADNDTLPATGSVIASDDIGGVKYQRVKLTWGPDGTANDADVATGKPIPLQLRTATGTAIGTAEDVASADGDGGIPMLVRRTAAPTNTSGTDGDYEVPQMNNGALWVSPIGRPFTCSTDITRPSDTTAYAANDALSDSTSAPTSGGFTFTSAAGKSGGSVLITDCYVASSNAAGTQLQGDIFIFNTSVTNINDNSAFAVSDAEIKTCVAQIPFVQASVGNNSIAHIQNLAITATASGSANLRFLVRVRNAYTPASAEVITVRISGFQID